MSHDNIVAHCHLGLGNGGADKKVSPFQKLKELNLTNLTCSDHNGSYCLPVLDQHKHHTLQKMKLGNLPISGLLLQSQEESGF